MYRRIAHNTAEEREVEEVPAKLCLQSKSSGGSLHSGSIEYSEQNGCGEQAHTMPLTKPLPCVKKTGSVWSMVDRINSCSQPLSSSCPSEMNFSSDCQVSTQPKDVSVSHSPKIVKKTAVGCLRTMSLLRNCDPKCGSDANFVPWTLAKGTDLNLCRTLMTSSLDGAGGQKISDCQGQRGSDPKENHQGAAPEEGRTVENGEDSTAAVPVIPQKRKLERLCVYRRFDDPLLSTAAPRPDVTRPSRSKSQRHSIFQVFSRRRSDVHGDTATSQGDSSPKKKFEKFRKYLANLQFLKPKSFRRKREDAEKDETVR